MNHGSDCNYAKRPHVGLLDVRAVRLERPRGRELAETVADHVFGDEHGGVLPPVVDGERQPHEIGEHHRAAAPRLDRLLLSGSLHLLDLAEEGLLHVRPLLK